MWDLEILHDILIAGSGFESCQERLSQFFDKTMLIRYDEIHLMQEESINGTEENFWSRIQEGLTANKKVLRELLGNLKAEGYKSIDDLQSLEKGYLSKILHTVAHLKDGFIGVDSRFYNLEEDSHGITRGLLQELISAPENYWIVRVKGKIVSTSEDPFESLRTFERKVKLTN